MWPNGVNMVRRSCSENGIGSWSTYRLQPFAGPRHGLRVKRDGKGCCKAGRMATMRLMELVSEAGAGLRVGDAAVQLVVVECRGRLLLRQGLRARVGVPVPAQREAVYVSCELGCCVTLLVLLAVIVEARRCDDRGCGGAIDADAANVRLLCCFAVCNVRHQLFGGSGDPQLLSGELEVGLGRSRPHCRRTEWSDRSKQRTSRRRHREATRTAYSPHWTTAAAADDDVAAAGGAECTKSRCS